MLYIENTDERKVGAIEALTPPFGELISTENDITNRVLRKSFV